MYIRVEQLRKYVRVNRSEKGGRQIEMAGKCGEVSMGDED
jgi:hypothetical protein